MKPSHKTKVKIKKAKHLSAKAQYIEAMRVWHDLLSEIKTSEPAVYAYGLLQLGKLYRIQGMEKSSFSHLSHTIQAFMQLPYDDKNTSDEAYRKDLIEATLFLAQHYMEENQPHELAEISETGLQLLSLDKNNRYPDFEKSLSFYAGEGY